MPFKSKKQQRYMFANDTKLAKEMASKTKDFKKLPEEIDSKESNYKKMRMNKKH